MNPPQWRVPSRWGLCFDGNEESYCSALDLAIESTEDRPFRYLEIGLGYGDCLRAVQTYLIQSGIKFHCIGVDIATCHPSASHAANYAFPGLVEIHLGGAAEYLAKAKEPLNFAFIDGCHGAPCVIADFLGMEPLIVSGGVVVFHDTDIGCQGLHWQEHCKSGIDARNALRELNLVDGKTRTGWRLIHETTGNKDLAGHGITVIQKV